MNTATGLIVPVDLAAYCVGTIDAQQQTVDFAGATTSYEDQLSANPQVQVPAFLGINVTRDPFIQPPIWSLEAGVHLHWAMPDTLVYAQNTGANLDFPAVPNRWLVTRVVISGETASGKTWIIESDSLSSNPPGANHVPSLPVQETDGSRGFRYVGAWQIFDSTWTEPVPPAGQSFKDLFGSEIHAVASGDIAFAAFYPNARNVFGFYDDLADLAGSPANLMYAVIGWFSDTTNDPLSKNLTLAQIQTQLGWTFDDSSGVLPSYSLYNGMVQDIDWDHNTEYIMQAQNSVQLDVAIGNNPAEALAAYFGGRNNFDEPVFEQLFVLFEAGLLSQYKQPQPGQLAQLVESLHERQFSSYDAGFIYTVVAKPPSESKKGLDDRDIAPNLPLPLADALNLLNQYQQEADLAKAETAQYQWQLFSDWYRILLVDQTNTPALNAAFQSFTQRVQLWPTIQSIQSEADAKLQTQETTVTNMLGEGLILKKTPATRYLEPAEPVVLIAGDNLTPAARYGGDSSYDASGYLVSRLTSQVLSSATIDATVIASSQFTGVLPPANSNLPYGVDVNNLLEEAALLDTNLTGAITGDQPSTLTADLQAWLNGTQQQGNAFTNFVGMLPSPLGVQWWANANPWFPLMMIWQADFHPLMATVTNGDLQNYSPEFFVNNYVLDPSNPGMLTYAPGTGPGSITIDPQTIDFNPTDPNSGTQEYHGAAVLSSKSAENLESLLTNYLKTNQDTTLATILAQLSDTNIMMQALSGLNNAMLMREQSLQLSIGISSTAPMPFRAVTSEILNIMDDIPALAPIFNGNFNPLRAGYMQLGLQILDTFGQKRPVTINNLFISNSLSTYFQGKLEPGIVYLQPRLSQEARLLFRWLAADTTEYDEMNVHPATSPICGWLLPNHVVEGFFFYNQQGKPLGSLTLNGDSTAIVWQATPGDEGTVNQDIGTVMQHENPHLRDTAVALSQSSTDFFQAFWKVVDTAAPLTTPINPNSQAGLAALVGRPVALVQVSLLLELHGTTAYNQSWNTLDSNQGSFVDTDNQLSTVQFPLVLGDITQLDDGLVGYFKQKDSSYDTSTFFSQAAPAGSASGVIQPPIDNLLLTPSSTPEGTAPSVTEGEQKVLILMDPRAGIHASMGILPTQFLQIPPDQYLDTLAGLEMTFLTAPVLKQPATLALPLGVEPGFSWSWIEETQTAQGISAWTVTPDIETASANAVWEYSPQSISEGWLRLNPNVLQFSLLNSSQQPVVNGGAVNSLSLIIQNLRQTAIVFEPAVIVNEGAAATGSIFYIHFGDLVDSADVALINVIAPGWTFQTLSDTQYGQYWAGTPVSGSPVSLDPGHNLSIALSNVKVSSTPGRAQVYFDYYNVVGDNDGVAISILTIQQSTPQSLAGPEALITPWR